MQTTMFETFSLQSCEPKTMISVFVGEVQAVYKKTSDKTSRLAKSVKEPSHVVSFLRTIWPDDLTLRESMYALFLDRANKIIGYAEISRGGTSGTICDPKILFQKALLCNSSGIILAHNHPSGNTKPSQADKVLTKKVQEGASLLDIQLLDHIILTEDAHYSFSDNNAI